MPDLGRPHDHDNASRHPPGDWREALSALPLDTPDGDGWTRLAAQLPISGHATRNTCRNVVPARRPARRHRRPLAWLTAAAALLALAVVPLQLLRQASPDETVPAPVSAADADLERLYAESARLEALVAMARDDSMTSAQATLLTASLDERIGAIDGTLAQPGLDSGQRMQLWQARVETLRELAGVETTQLWLSARGEHWDTALVQID